MVGHARRGPPGAHGEGCGHGDWGNRVDELINEQMQDTNNYDFNPRNPHGRDPFWSEPIHGDVYIEKGEWEDEYEVMFPDEVVRAINKIDKYTYGEIDLDYDFFEERSKKKHAEFSHSWTQASSSMSTRTGIGSSEA